MIAAARPHRTGEQRMDLIKYLEGAAVDLDVLWESGNAQEPLETWVRRVEMSFEDNAAMARLLEARSTMICMVVTPDGGETESPGDTQDDPASPENIPEDDSGRDPQD